MGRRYNRGDAAAMAVLVRVGAWLRRGQAAAKSRGRAVVLVITLWIIVVLGVIASSLAFDVQVGSKLAGLQREQFMAYNLAKSAVGLGITHLQNDLIIDYNENPNQMTDSFADVWAMRDQREKDREVQVDPKNYPERTYEVRIEDEEAKIPLNFANFKVLKAMMEYYGFEAPDSDEIAYAIIDYRDQDDMAGAEPGSYENEYFSAKSGQRIKANTTSDQLRYRMPNERYLSTDQLLEVYGIDQFPEVYLGFNPDAPDEDALAARDAAAMGRRVREKRQRRRRGHEPLPMKDIVTVSPEDSGRVNLNTASIDVLTILIHAATDFASIDQAKAAAEAIAEFRGDNDKRAPDLEKAFKSLKDVEQVPGVDAGALGKLGSLGVQPAFRSETFRVIGIGKTKRAEREVEAVVQRKLEIYNPDDASLASNRGRGIDSKRRRSSDRRRGSQKGGRPDDNYIRVPAVRVLQWIE